MRRIALMSVALLCMAARCCPDRLTVTVSKNSDQTFEGEAACLEKGASSCPPIDNDKECQDACKAHGCSRGSVVQAPAPKFHCEMTLTAFFDRHQLYHAVCEAEITCHCS